MSASTSTMSRAVDQASLPVVEDQRDPEAGPAPMMPTPAPEPSAARLILTLGIAGLLSGLSLVLVYMATEPAIERNRLAALERAVLEVLPGAQSFEVFVERDGEVLRHDPEGGIPSGAVVYAGFDADGDAVGFAIPGEGPGFQDTLELIVGWDAAAERVIGLAVLADRETPGLGDKIYTDPGFTGSFDRLALPATLVDPGRRANEDEVDGITGATITAEAVVNIVNESVSAWRDRLPDQASLTLPAEGDLETASESQDNSGSGRDERHAE